MRPSFSGILGIGLLVLSLSDCASRGRTRIDDNPYFTLTDAQPCIRFEEVSHAYYYSVFSDWRCTESLMLIAVVSVLGL